MWLFTINERQKERKEKNRRHEGKNAEMVGDTLEQKKRQKWEERQVPGTRYRNREGGPVSQRCTVAECTIGILASILCGDLQILVEQLVPQRRNERRRQQQGALRTYQSLFDKRRPSTVVCVDHGTGLPWYGTVRYSMVWSGRALCHDAHVPVPVP